jgi:hypothetical protein
MSIVPQVGFNFVAVDGPMKEGDGASPAALGVRGAAEHHEDKAIMIAIIVAFITAG